MNIIFRLGKLAINGEMNMMHSIKTQYNMECDVT